jgi:ectoine hydroxylase
MSHILTDEQVKAYRRDGFVTVRRLFDAEEIGLLHRTALADQELDKRSFGRADGEGGTVRLSLWNHPGENVYGMFARCQRLVDSAERLLEGEVYHYHSKMILKDAKVGGAWAWHQDYGYWYHFGVLYPLLTSVTVAVDPATRENGCLQVLKGSHLMGRIEHKLTGDQAGADMERVNEALKQLELVYCEAEPGDATFFDCNLLHRSDQNRSDKARWSLICCYNAARNNPYKDAQHPRYTPLVKVNDGAIKRIGMKRFEAGKDDSAWLRPETDRIAGQLKEAETKPN